VHYSDFAQDEDEFKVPSIRLPLAVQAARLGLRASLREAAPSPACGRWGLANLSRPPPIRGLFAWSSRCRRPTQRGLIGGKADGVFVSFSPGERRPVCPGS